MLIYKTRAFLLTLVVISVTACQSDRHAASDFDASKTPVCVECYEAVSTARRAHPVADAGSNAILKTYECPCCVEEMSVYIEDGTHMVRCDGCATEGVAWDQCRPVAM